MVMIIFSLAVQFATAITMSVRDWELNFEKSVSYYTIIHVDFKLVPCKYSLIKINFQFLPNLLFCTKKYWENLEYIFRRMLKLSTQLNYTHTFVNTIVALSAIQANQHSHGIAVQNIVVLTDQL
jgi:hypothetical protein